MYYICMDCGNEILDECLAQTKEYYEYWGGEISYSRECCPKCYGNVVPAIRCENCGRLIPEDERVIHLGLEICLSCAFEEEDSVEE